MDAIGTWPISCPPHKSRAWRLCHHTIGQPQPNQPLLGKAPNTKSNRCVGKICRFQRFANASKVKRWASTMSRGRPALLAKWKAVPAWKDSGAMDWLKKVSKIAVDEEIRASDLPATRCVIHTGSRRLMSPLNAMLMIFSSAARLHTCGSSDWAHLCDLIYIIGLGLPVVVASTWRIADGQPIRLAAQASGIIFHASAARRKPCTFMLDKILSDAHPNLQVALDYCAKQTKSQWKVVRDKGQPLATNGVRAKSIRELAGAILNLAVLEASGCRGHTLGSAS